MSKAREIAALGACMGDFEEWLIQEQRKKAKKRKPKKKPHRAKVKAPQSRER